ncbi:MAG: hypothetical protein ACI8UO_000285 [Verrucomicrobiales bacterium]
MVLSKGLLPKAKIPRLIVAARIAIGPIPAPGALAAGLEAAFYRLMSQGTNLTLYYY